MSEEPWTEVCNIAQEAVTKIIPKKKKCKKANWLPEKVLQIAEERSKRQRRKGKTDPTECRVPKNSKVPSPGDHPDPGIKLGSRALQADSLPTEL